MLSLTISGLQLGLDFTGGP
ncbi:hypothetical protein [Marinobacterium aestuariivivens]|uniref:Uncharacterized protein n=1 Tax=Marinobacterium aestuariivivens TaxID=1698799 RepID=A0ABW2A5C0_9GAMM